MLCCFFVLSNWNNRTTTNTKEKPKQPNTKEKPDNPIPRKNQNNQYPIPGRPAIKSNIRKEWSDQNDCYLILWEVKKPASCRRQIIISWKPMRSWRRLQMLYLKYFTSSLNDVFMLHSQLIVIAWIQHIAWRTAPAFSTSANSFLSCKIFFTDFIFVYL